tara:strand:- start:689 stop:3490 length:2802 start_codon:yes stop_codon:yes gene_type:complete
MSLQNILKRAKKLAFKTASFNLHRYKVAAVDVEPINDAAADYFANPDGPLIVSDEAREYLSTVEGQNYARSLLPEEQADDFINKALSVTTDLPSEEIAQRPPPVEDDYFRLNEIALENPQLFSRGLGRATSVLESDRDAAVAMTQALEVNLRPPEPGRVDQRLNFFLKQPKYFETLPELQSNVEVIFNQLNANFGPFSSFEEAIADAKGGSEKQKFILGLMNDTAGPQLIKRLENMLLGVDENGNPVKPDPTLISYLNNAIIGVSKNMRAARSKSRLEQEGEGVYEQTAAPEGGYAGRPEMMENYILPILRGYMLGLLEEAMSFNNEILKNAYSLAPEKGGYTDKQIKDIQESAEYLDIFSTLIQQNIREIQQTDAKGFKQFLKLLFKDNEEQVLSEIATGVSSAIEEGEAGEEVPLESLSPAEQAEKRQGYAEGYARQMIGSKDSLTWAPDWSSLIRPFNLGKEMQNIAGIKQAIFDAGEKYPEQDNIASLLLGQGGIGKALDKYYADENQKKAFIDRTLSRGKDSLKFYKAAPTSSESRNLTEQEVKIKKVLQGKGYITKDPGGGTKGLLDRDKLEPNELEEIRGEIKPHSDKGGTPGLGGAGSIRGGKFYKKFTEPLDSLQKDEEGQNQLQEAYNIIQNKYNQLYHNTKGEKRVLNPKEHMKRKVPNLYPLMIDMRDSGRFGPNAASLLASILKPTAEVMEGHDDSTKTHQRMDDYYNLMGTSLSNKAQWHRQKKEMKDERKKLKKIERDSLKDIKKLPPEQQQQAKDMLEQQIKDKHKNFTQVLDRMEDNLKLRNDLSKKEADLGIIKDKMDKIERKEKPTSAEKGVYDRIKGNVPELSASIEKLKERLSEFDTDESFSKYKYPVASGNIAFMRMIYAQATSVYNRIKKYSRLLKSSSLEKYASKDVAGIEDRLNTEINKFNSLCNIVI